MHSNMVFTNIYICMHLIMILTNFALKLMKVTYPLPSKNSCLCSCLNTCWVWSHSLQSIWQLNFSLTLVGFVTLAYNCFIIAYETHQHWHYISSFLQFLNLYLCLQVLNHFKFSVRKVQPEWLSVYQLDE